MKKISPRMGRVAKEVAKTLAKVVGKGLAVGGGVAALGLGMAGCESTPAVATQIINGVIIDSYQGNSAVNGSRGTYYIVDQDGNSETKEDQRLLYVGDYDVNKYLGIQVGSYIAFQWDQYSNKNGYSNPAHIISVNGEKAR
jgi:hypothetical protein